MVQTAQTVVHFAHFQVQAQLALPGSTSRAHCAHACSQVSVYSHLSLGPQGCNPLLCLSASVLHSRSVRYNWDQPDTIAVTWHPSAMHAVKFLYTATFHWGPKIATLCFRQMYLHWFCSDLDLAVSLHSWQLTRYWGQPACWALCTFQVSWNTNHRIPLMQQQVFSFLINDNQQTYLKDTKKKKEKCSEITAIMMAQSCSKR